MIDIDKSGKIDLEELKTLLKTHIPSHKLTYNDIVQILNSFDTNGDGVIDENEYYAVIERSVAMFEDNFEDVDFGDQCLPTI
jgi:Ca2+-binding EF-hand superfamily protein